MELKILLEKHRNKFSWLFDDPFTEDKGLEISLGRDNDRMASVDIRDMKMLDQLISEWLKESDKLFAFGGYGEDRDFYRRSDIFTGDEIRTIHLGIDFWLPARTEIFLPLNGKIHSYSENFGKGNYGPTIITTHLIEEYTFHMLWGHLSQDSLQRIKTGQSLNKGQMIGRIGNYQENGQWPPHLHFQIIHDINENNGDYPGVSAPSKAPYYMNNCPDPRIIFNLN